MTGQLLMAKDLSKVFDGVEAVAGVSMDVSAGELVGLVGPNGSGKSTLFNLITGFIRPDSGRVSWKGEDISHASASARSRIGMVRTFQQRMLFNGLSVQENLEAVLIARRFSGDESERIGKTLELVGLPATTLRQLAGELSWGQSRLLGMCLAFLCEPDLILLDEPFAGLNRIAAIDVIEAIGRLNEAGIAFVIIEHAMELLLPLVDRTLVMASGRVIADGPSSSVISLPEVQAAYFGVID